MTYDPSQGGQTAPLDTSDRPQDTPGKINVYPQSFVKVQNKDSIKQRGFLNVALLLLQRINDVASPGQTKLGPRDA